MTESSCCPPDRPPETSSQTAERLTWLDPALVKLSVFISWIFLLVYEPCLGITEHPGTTLISPFYSAAALFMLATLALLVFASGDHEIGRRWCFAALFAMGGTLLYRFGNLSFLIECMSGLVVGATTAVISLTWVRFLSDSNRQRTVATLPLVLSLGAILSFTILYLPVPASHGAAALFPLFSLPPISSEPFSESARRVSCIPNGNSSRGSAAIFLLLVLGVGGISLVLGFFDRLNTTVPYTAIWYLALFFIPLSTIGATVLKFNSKWLSSSVLIPAASLVVTLVPFSTILPSGASMGLVIIGSLSLELSLVLIPILFTDSFPRNPSRLFFGLRLSMSGCYTLGWAFCTILSDSHHDLILAQAYAVLLLIGMEAIVLVFFKLSAALSESSARDEEAEETPSATPSTSEVFDERLAQLGALYQLTPREQEVLALLSQGYSNPYIQKRLFISEGTVNSHTRNIYAKMHVHSKDEVIAIIHNDTPPPHPTYINLIPGRERGKAREEEQTGTICWKMTVMNLCCKFWSAVFAESKHQLRYYCCMSMAQV